MSEGAALSEHERAAAVLAGFIGACMIPAEGMHFTSASPASLAMGCATALSNKGLLAPARAGAADPLRQAVEAEFERGVRQAITWLRADYPYGEGPDWRENGAEWIADRLAEHTADLRRVLDETNESHG